MSYFEAKLLKCTKFDFGWGSAPDPAGRAHSGPPDPLTGFEGVLLLREGKGIGGKGKGGGRGRKGRKRGRKGREKGREGEGTGRGKVASWLLGYGRPCMTDRQTDIETDRKPWRRSSHMAPDLRPTSHNDNRLYCTDRRKSKDRFCSLHNNNDNRNMLRRREFCARLAGCLKI